MSSLTNPEKKYLENLLFNIKPGYVLDFTDSTYGEFFSSHGIDIHGSKYNKFGTSKAKKLRAFWEIEPDTVVAPVISELLDIYETNNEINNKIINQKVLQKARSSVARILDDIQVRPIQEVENFLNKDFVIPNIKKLPIDSDIITIIDTRIQEAQLTIRAGAHLSTIILCGSVLEGVLLGVANKNPKMFNQSTSSPKYRDGNTKPFNEWNLADLIDVAYDLRLIDVDVKKFSHVLREFRNYIHPNEQLKAKFKPDMYTANICYQVLKAGLANLVRDR